MGEDKSEIAEPETLPVVIGTITAGSVRVEMAAGIIQCLMDRCVLAWAIEASGPYLDMGRNRNVRRVMRNEGKEFGDWEFFLTVDSDMVPTPQHVRKAVDAARAYHAEHGIWPVIGGTYQGVHNSHREIIAYRWVDCDEGHNPTTDPDKVVRRNLHALQIEEIMDIPEADGALMQVGGIGTGFLLTHKSILEKMAEHYAEPQPWFYEGVIDGTWFGEDLVFCMRAEALGHPILLHTGIRLTHYKPIGLSF